MSRKSIFLKLKESINYQYEIIKIDRILKDNIVEIPIDDIYGRWRKYEFESFINEFIFLEWKNRGTCINCEDMRKILKINSIVIRCIDGKEITLEQLLDYFEYAINILLLLLKIDERKVNYRIDNKLYCAALDNIENVLSKLNYEIQPISKDDKYILVEKNPAATAVAEIVDENIADDVIQYNHYLLKGDMETKKKILFALGAKLEPQRNNLKEANKNLELNIFFMLNNLNIRHNNCDVSNEKNYKKYIANMSKEILEEYYDELYQMILLAFLLIDNVDRMKKIDELKAKIGGK